jgi:hypothetical protein
VKRQRNWPASNHPHRIRRNSTNYQDSQQPASLITAVLLAVYLVLESFTRAKPSLIVFPRSLGGVERRWHF